jgi:hypothetical protein
MDNTHSTSPGKLSGNALIGVFLFFALVLGIFSDVLTFIVGIVLIGGAFMAYYNAEHVDSH